MFSQFNFFSNVISLHLSAAGVSAQDIACMGITTQRNTFLTWDK